MPRDWLVRRGPRDRARVELAYRLAFARPVMDAERDAVLAFLARQAALVAADMQGAGKPIDARQQALADFCLVLLNGNEFVYVR